MVECAIRVREVPGSTPGSPTEMEDETKPSDVDIKIQPSMESWERLMDDAILGNLMFPQAFFAQGILLANGIVREASKEGLPHSAFLENNPPEEFIKSKLTEAKNKAHHAYKVKPVISMFSRGDVRTVWKYEKYQALIVLEYFARLSDDEEVGRELLKTAAQGLRSERVQNLSKTYKGEIQRFTGKYRSSRFQDRDKHYGLNRDSLFKNLQDLIYASAKEIRLQMIERLKKSHPEEKGLIKRLEIASDPTYPFGDPEISTPHPLRNPDYE